MRELYNEFFYIPKHGKIREKVMLTRIAMTITIVIMCLAAMSITAYAYFSYNVTSGSNIIKSASFYTDVTVQIIAEDGTVVDTITTNTSDHKSHSAELTANKTYTVTVQHNDRSTAQTGFVIVTADNCETKYHTQQLGRDGDGNTYTITFKLTPGADTIVTFRSHWGTSSFYDGFKNIGENDERYIINGDEVELIIGGAKPSSGNEENGDTTETPGNTSEGTGETTTTPSTDTTSTTTGGTNDGESSTPTPDSTTTTTDTTISTETTTPETTGTEETTTTTEPSSSTTETTTQTTEPAVTESASTDETTETQPATENAETTGAPTTEASE